MEKKNSFIKDVLEIAIGTIVITFILTSFVLKPYKVNGTSMYPNLKDGDFGYSFIITKKFGINRFDIVVIDTKLNGEDRLLVKRVIGLPNETIEFKNNQLFINGKQTDQKFLESNVITNDLKITLQDDEYYCLGDNRQISRDSRFYGPFSNEDIISTHLFVIWPLSEFGEHK